MHIASLDDMIRFTCKIMFLVGSQGAPVQAALQAFQFLVAGVGAAYSRYPCGELEYWGTEGSKDALSQAACTLGCPEVCSVQLGHLLQRLQDLEWVCENYIDKGRKWVCACDIMSKRAGQ
jgi:hypothetical protein